MLVPLKQWFCDVCGEVIESPEQGKLRRLNDDKNRQYDFRITHDSCLSHGDRPKQRDTPLALLVGPGGIAFLLFLLDPSPASSQGGVGTKVKNLPEYAEIFRRLHVPYYEEARQFMAQAERERMIEVRNEFVLSDKNLLRKIIRRYSG